MAKFIYLIIAVLLIVFSLNGAHAVIRSGFNEYYYTDYYKPTVYYSTPYHVPYYNYSSSYYPTYSYYNYYPAYSYNYYQPRYYSYTPVLYNYPAYSYATYPYRSASFYSSDAGWGISISSGSICGYYGYC